jgi:hypothetical protein
VSVSAGEAMVTLWKKLSTCSINQMDSWTVQHVRREANTAAHQIAQYAATREEKQIWTSNHPNFICSTVLSEQEAI